MHTSASARTAPSVAVRTAAIAVLVACLALAGWAIWLDVAEPTTRVARGWTSAVPGVLLGATGAALLLTVGRHPIAVLLCFFGLYAEVCGVASAWVNHSAAHLFGRPGEDLAVIVNQRFSLFLFVVVPALLALFPDGRLPRVRWVRAVAITAIALPAAATLITVLAPWQVLIDRVGGQSPVVLERAGQPWGDYLPYDLWLELAWYINPAMLACIVLAPVAPLWRWKVAGEQERLQLSWLAWGGGLAVLGLGAASVLLPYWIATLTLVACIAILCLAVLVAVTRHGLYGIDRVLSWTLVYGILVAAVVSIDVALIALLGSRVDDQNLALIAVIVVLLAYAPLRERLLGAAQRWVAGRRGDPYGAVSALAGRIADAREPADQLEHLVRVVARTFAAPYVAVEVVTPDDGRLTAQTGVPAPDAIAVDLHQRGERIGRLRMVPGRVALSVRDEQLLSDLVRLAVTAVWATIAEEELRRARRELVIATEAERRRLRHDLHDGLGPSLAAVKMRIEAARNLARSDAARSDELLDEAARGVSEAVGEIRRVAHGLGPAALDDLGFARAVEHLASGFGSATVEVDVADLSPAQEVALHRILGEALNNVRRHAAAERVRVTVTGDDQQVSATVADDGRGMPADAPGGLGLPSMRRRAAELGGRLDVRSSPAGTTVTVTLPRPDGPEWAGDD